MNWPFQIFLFLAIAHSLFGLIGHRYNRKIILNISCKRAQDDSLYSKNQFFRNKKSRLKIGFLWSHLDSNQRPTA